jgi:hypothetical protein
MDGTGHQLFSGILVNFMVFAGSIISMSLLVDYLSTGRYWWVPVPVIGAAIVLLAVKPDLTVSALQSFSSGISVKGTAAILAGGLAAGGLLSGV